MEGEGRGAGGGSKEEERRPSARVEGEINSVMPSPSWEDISRSLWT